MLAADRLRPTAKVGLADDVAALRDDLYRFAVASARDPEVAEDVVQDTMVRARSERGDIRDPRAWAFTVVLNLLRSHFRRRRWLPLGAARDLPSADFAGEHAEAEAVHRALGRLSPGQRTSLLLHVIGGFTYGEIARLEGGSEVAVKQRVYRARLAFRAAYGDAP